MTRLLIVLAAIGVGCAPSVALDSDEEDLPLAEFDPAARIVPFPNNLVLEDDEVALPRQCVEPEIARELRHSLNRLDGFGSYKPNLQATFTETPDEDSLEGRVFVACRQVGGVPVDPADHTADPTAIEEEIETDLDVIARFDTRDCASVDLEVDAVSIVPQQPLGARGIPADPLNARSICGVVLLRGITTREGREFQPSPAWTLFRQREPPVEVEDGRVVENRTPLDSADHAALREFHDVWSDHQPWLDFVTTWRGVERDDILLAWEFTVQTLTLALDATVTDTPAQQVVSGAWRDLVDWPIAAVDNPFFDDAAPACKDASSDGSAPIFCLSASSDIEASFRDLRGAGAEDIWQLSPCGSDAGPLTNPCDELAYVIEGGFHSPIYSSVVANPAGLDEGLPGEWSDPIWATPRAARALPFVAAIPQGPAPSGGFPIVLLGHGTFGSAKTYLAQLAPVLARAGMVAIAIDWVNHGERKVRVSDDEGLGCDGDRDDLSVSRCFEHIISRDLAAGRDNLRQSVIDALALIEALKAERCVDATCASTVACTDELCIDPGRLGYVGTSLGGILGTLVATVSPDVDGAVLNVGGAGWVDTFSHSDTDFIKCPIVNNLIAAGVLDGELWTGPSSGALCQTDGWLSDPRYEAFASSAQWALDPGDPAAYAPLLRDKLAANQVAILVQEVRGDAVVPNLATRKQARLIGLRAGYVGSDDNGDGLVDPLAAAEADDASGYAPAPTSFDPDADWISYETTSRNLYHHASLMSPASLTDAGWRAVAQIQADAVSFLAQVLGAP